MSAKSERYVVDESGNRVAVVIEIAEFNRMLEEIEELAAIRAYDEAKRVVDEIVPFAQAVEEIERSR